LFSFALVRRLAYLMNRRLLCSVRAKTLHTPQHHVKTGPYFPRLKKPESPGAIDKPCDRLIEGQSVHLAGLASLA